MPFASEFDEVYANIQLAFKPNDDNREDDVQLVCTRADELVRGGTVMTDILKGIAEAELIIVELTGRNPNVFYELGIAHTTRDEESVVLITQSMDDVPFDVKSYRCVEYSPTPAGFSELRKKLADMVRSEILPTRMVFRLKEGQTGESGKIQGNDRQFYSFSICDVMLGMDGSSQFRLEVYRHQLGQPGELVLDDKQPVLKREQTVAIPHTSWALKYDGKENDLATFCVCRFENI